MPGATIWDSDLSGFGVRVSKAGAKSYVLKYRVGAMQRWYTIGRHGSPWTPEKARQEAKRLLGRVAEGRDPAADRKRERHAETLAAFSKLYLSNYAEPFKKASSLRNDRANLNNHILPVLGAMRMNDITHGDIAQFHLSLKASPYMANRCVALLSHMFKKARAWGVCSGSDNPAQGIEKFEEKARERYLSAGEISRLGRALRVVERAGRRPYAVAGIRLLMFTGARHSEILTLRWDYVDLDRRVLRLPDSKTGAKTVSLSAPAVEVLSNLPRIAGNPYVICGRKEGERLVNLQKFWRRLRKAALIPDVRLHDLRHSFASVGASGGMSLPVIGALLGHKRTQTTARYAHLSDDPKKAAAESIAAVIDANLRGETGEVVYLSQGADAKSAAS